MKDQSTRRALRDLANAIGFDVYFSRGGEVLEHSTYGVYFPRRRAFRADLEKAQEEIQRLQLQVAALTKYLKVELVFKAGEPVSARYEVFPIRKSPA